MAVIDQSLSSELYPFFIIYRIFKVSYQFLSNLSIYGISLIVMFDTL